MVAVTMMIPCQQSSNILSDPDMVTLDNNSVTKSEGKSVKEGCNLRIKDESQFLADMSRGLG